MCDVEPSGAAAGRKQSDVSQTSECVKSARYSDIPEAGRMTARPVIVQALD